MMENCKFSLSGISSRLTHFLIIFIALSTPHSTLAGQTNQARRPVLEVEDAQHWIDLGQAQLQQKISQPVFDGVAKNVLFFLGDGMSPTTTVAARILKGQLEGSQFGGEESSLAFENFPYTGVSKTFCSDTQVADSACSATAYLSGTKANVETIGVTPAVKWRDCQGMMNVSNQVDSILAWAQAAGKSTGIISTSRITDASPAGTYAHIADRNWENDAIIRNHGQDPDFCDDIAEQLILSSPGKNFNVILGGGRRHLLPNTVVDPEHPDTMGLRTDGKNLIQIWSDDVHAGQKAHFVWNKDQFDKVDANDTDYLLGLFSIHDMDYVGEMNRSADPTLEEMTQKAIEILQKNPNGFFLFIEGAKIDSAHHENHALKALYETLEFDKAIQLATQMTQVEDTLTIVTADHTHPLALAGPAVPRGNPVWGFGGISDVDNLPFSTLSYANGPGYKHPDVNGGGRYDMTNDVMDDVNYMHMSGVPRGSDSHGGDDTGVYSQGPQSHRLTGVFMQSFIPHLVGYATCTGQGLHRCDQV